MNSLPRFERWAVRLASLIVPEHLRGEWIEEWRAELSYGEGREGRIRTAAGAFVDAFEVRRIARERVKRDGRSPVAFVHDARVAIRSLLKAPAFTTVVVVTLALGIGGGTAIFTLLDRVVIDPLPYPEQHRLVRLENSVPCVDATWQMATGQYVLYGDRAATLEEIGAYRIEGANASTPDGARRVVRARVSVSMMDLLGAATVRGRLIGRDDDRPGAPGVALLSHEYWTTTYGAEEGVVDRTLLLDDITFTVIGVLRPGVVLPMSGPNATPDVWTALGIDPAGPHLNNHVIPMIARLSTGSDSAAAKTELDGLAMRLPELYPSAYSRGFLDECGFRTEVVPLKSSVVGDVAGKLWLLLAAAALVLLIVCANVANLLLVRTEGRGRELAVREVLGAGRLTLLQHVLTESLLLSVAGGLLGIALAGWLLPLLLLAAPPDLPRMGEVRIAGDSALFALGVAFAIGVGLALVSSVRVGARSLSGRLREGGRGSSEGDRARVLHGGFVVVQVALALMLVIASGSVLQTVDHLLDLDLGFEPRGVVAVDLGLTASRYPTNPEAWDFYARVVDRVRRIPGVTSAGMTQELPVEGGFGCTVQGFDDQAVLDRLARLELSTCAGQESTTPGYFRTMGIPVLRGRTLEVADLDDPTRASVVVSESFAERFWGTADPIGNRVGPSGTSGPDAPMYTVVGVVGDVPAGGVDGEPAIAVYYPVVWHPEGNVRWNGNLTLAVRTDDDPSALVPAIREAIAGVDPAIPLSNVRTMADVVDASIARLTFTSLLLRVAAALALVLAAVGLYGMISYVVSRRSREIGMRMALGAHSGAVQTTIVGRSLRLGVAGVALGLLLTVVVGYLFRGLLSEMAAARPGTIGIAVAVLIGVVCLASWLPARRAARIDPARALRAD